MILKEIQSSNADALPEFVVNTRLVQVIGGCYAIAVGVADYVLAIVNKSRNGCCREWRSNRGAPLSSSSQRVVLVSDNLAIRQRDLFQTILKIPGVLRRPRPICLRSQVAIVVVAVGGAAGVCKPIERLVIVDRAQVRRSSIADSIVTVGSRQHVIVRHPSNRN